MCCALLAGITLSAQGPGPRGGHLGDKGRHHGQNIERPDFTPEQIATLRVKELTLMLDLNEKQQTQVEQLELEIAKDRIAKRDSDKKPGKELTDDERYELRTEKLDKQIAHKNSMRGILNKEQFEKWEKAAIQRGKTKRQRKHKAARDGKGK